MHKKIEAELVKLAHSILEMKNNDDVNELHKKATELCEKLSVLKFVDAYINSNVSEVENIEADEDKVELSVEEEVEEEEIELIIDDVVEETAPIEEELEVKIESEVIIEKKNEEFISIEDTIEEEKVEEFVTIGNTLEEELKDAISADVATQLFENVTKENPVIEENLENNQRSLNDTLFKNNLQIGLNDRIAFVKYLFDGSQEDFNRVLSQLNSFKSEKEAKDFINKFVKPDYNWSAKEEYENRLVNLIERKFL
jgi:hypothetical protein